MRSDRRWQDEGYNCRAVVLFTPLGIEALQPSQLASVGSLYNPGGAERFVSGLCLSSCSNRAGQNLS